MSKRQKACNHQVAFAELSCHERTIITGSGGRTCSASRGSSAVFDTLSSVIEDAWRLLNSVNEWVRFADAKAGGVLAGAGVLAGVLAAAGLSDKFDHASTAALALGVASGFLAVVAAALSLRVILPALRVGEPVSLIYFEHVARKYNNDILGHAAAVKALITDEEQYFQQIAAQVWANSKVARAKFLASAWALTTLAVAVLLGGVAAIVTLF